MVKLNPLKKPSTKNEIFAVCDIEAKNWIEFLVMGYYGPVDSYGPGGSVDSDLYYEDFIGSKGIKSFVNFIFKEEQLADIIFAHFGGIYDFLFFLNYFLGHPDFVTDGIIPRGSGLLCFSVSTKATTSDITLIKNIKKKHKKSIIIEKNGYLIYKDRTIEFRDSSAFLPFGLGNLAKNFDVKHKKLSTDYNFKKVTPSLRKYLKHDCLALYEVIETYRSWDLIAKAGPAHTMAGQALRVLRTFIKDPILSLSDKQDTFVRKSYVGGRTEIFKPLFLPKKTDKKQKLYVMDVNSLYPTVMRDNKFPNKCLGFTKEYFPKKIGFYDAEVEVPKDMYIPPLGTRAEIDGWKKFIFPTGRFKGRWSTVELEYARSLGVKIISTGQGIIFSSGGYIFKDFIDTLYAIRKKPECTQVDNILAKLLMNSCYGRFGLKRESETLILDDGRVGLKNITELPMNGDVRIGTITEKLTNSFSNVAIPAWVTSLARIHMHRDVLLKCEKTLYNMDTDSAFTTKKMPSSNELGGLKLEYECNAACFLLPKTYIAVSPEKIFKAYGKVGTLTDKKVTMKGFGKTEAEKFEFNDFLGALEGDLRLLKARVQPKVAKFKTAIKNYKVLAMLEGCDRQIKSVYDKRQIIKLSDGTYDTVPLHIENGKVNQWEHPNKKKINHNRKILKDQQKERNKILIKKRKEKKKKVERWRKENLGSQKNIPSLSLV